MASSTVLNTLGRTVYQLGFQISPIIFVDGIATSLGGLLPIVAVTEAASFLTGLLNGGTDLDLDSFLCHYAPMAGTTLVENQVGHYPFANQSVAANAVISQPLRISFQMSATVKQAGGHTAKFVSFLALKAVFDKHQAAGGTYTLLTPTGIYQNCLLLRVADNSTGETKQAQSRFQLDFEKPLLTLADAAAAQSTLTSKIDGGLTTDGSTSGISSALSSAVSSVSSVLGSAISSIESAI